MEGTEDRFLKSSVPAFPHYQMAPRTSTVGERPFGQKFRSEKPRVGIGAGLEEGVCSLLVSSSHSPRPIDNQDFQILQNLRRKFPLLDRNQAQVK